MKRVVLLLFFAVVLATSCDPDWALNPKNEGRAYIVNKTDADIIFRGYTSWVKEVSNEGYPTCHSWYYTLEGKN